MRHFLILACLLFGTGAMADEADFDFKSLGAKKALRDYKATLAKEDKAKQKAIEEMEAEAKKAQKTNRVELIMNLEQALKQAMQAGNLEEANKISGAIKALKKGASPAGASVAGSKGKKKAKKSKARIPRDAVKRNGHHYKVLFRPMTWYMAKAYCESVGGHLVRIESAEGQNYIAQMVKGSPVDDWAIDGAWDGRKWIYSNGQPVSFFYWMRGQPTLQYPQVNIFMRVSGGEKWGDGGRDGRRAFICEWDE